MTRAHPHLLQDCKTRQKSCSSREPARCNSHLHSFLLLRQQYLHHNHQSSLLAFPLGLMKWQQRNSQVTPNQRRLFPIGRTLVGSVEHDHDHSHWSSHASNANTAYTTPAGTLNAVRPGLTTSKITKIFPSATPLRPTHFSR